MFDKIVATKNKDFIEYAVKADEGHYEEYNQWRTFFKPLQKYWKEKDYDTVNSIWDHIGEYMHYVNENPLVITAPGATISPARGSARAADWTLRAHVPVNCRPG